MSKRDIVQISAVGVPEQIEGGYTHLYALCDDGTVWFHTASEGGWHKLPDIPDDIPAQSRPEKFKLEHFGGSWLVIDMEGKVITGSSGDGFFATKAAAERHKYYLEAQA
jgi:hypothetical protein